MTKRVNLDAATVEQLLDGRMQPDDAPPELARVAALLAAAAEVPAAATADPAFVAALAAEVNAAPNTLSTRRKPVLAKFLTVKAGVLAGVLAFGAAGAAAATNTLPAGAQHDVATAAKHVGINLPDKADDHASDASSKDDSSATTSNDDETTTTTVEHGKPDDNHGADVSKAAHETEPGEDHGAAVCAVASGGKCTDHRGSGDDNNDNQGDHGNSGDDHSTTTAVTTPESHDGGGSNGADDHHGGHGPDTSGSEGSSHGSGSNSGRD